MRCEGNLLAARQEIDKLGAAAARRRARRTTEVEQAVADVARFDVFQLSEAWLAGDAARALRILASLEDEGEALALLLWQLGEDVHALAAVLRAAAQRHVGRSRRCAIGARVGQAPGGDGARGAGASRRRRFPRMLPRLAKLDALAKGIGSGNAVGRARDARAACWPARPLAAAA